MKGNFQGVRHQVVYTNCSTLWKLAEHKGTVSDLIAKRIILKCICRERLYLHYGNHILEREM